MTVNITFSKAPNGQTMENTQDSGVVAPGNDPTATVTDIYIRHDADYAPITDCAWYMTRCVSDKYLGTDPDLDLAEVLAWGATDENGFRIRQNTAIQQTAIWSSFNSNQGTINNQFALPIEAVTNGTPANAGEIPVNGEAHVQVAWKIPSVLSGSRGAGYRGVSLVFAYSATS